jgi:hypothetical protein
MKTVSRGARRMTNISRRRMARSPELAELFPPRPPQKDGKVSRHVQEPSIADKNSS